MNKEIQYQDLGSIDYQEAWDYQTVLLNVTVQQKITNRNLPELEQKATQNHLLFCEHPHVYTLGKSGSLDHLLLNETQLQNKDIQFYKINRGGDITYHGPGQIVGYPILDLDNFFTDIHKYLRLLEEAIIQTLAHYEVKAGRLVGATGVWIEPEHPLKARKICAMGIRCSRWVTMHGWAFNVNTNLDFFGNIVPCGITDKAVTSLNRELGVKQMDIDEVKKVLLNNFAALFDAKIVKTK